MAKLGALLLSVLLTCALLLVTSQHRARKAWIDLERAQGEARKHDVEWKQLQLELTHLAKHSRIDAVARRDLKMQPITPERTLYLNAPAGAAKPAAAAAAAADGAPRPPQPVPVPVSVAQGGAR
jgi:cell division protein FtsL